MKLLHLDASALGSHSVSRGLTAAIVGEFTRNNPGTEVIYHDLVANPLNHWTPVADASDPVAERRDLALSLGATAAVDPTSDDVVAFARSVCGGVDYAFDAAGSPALARTGFKATGLGGTVVLVGAPSNEAMLEGIHHGLLVGQEKRIIGSMMGTGNAARDVPTLIGLWRTGALELERLVTADRPIDDINVALDDLKAGHGLRTVINFEGDEL